jgi:hypothetical protein
MLGVNYDEPMRTGPEPLAKIELADGLAQGAT